MDKIQLQTKIIDSDIDAIPPLKIEHINNRANLKLETKIVNCDMDEVSSKRKRKKSKILLEMITDDFDSNDDLNYDVSKKSKELQDSDPDFDEIADESSPKKLKVKKKPVVKVSVSSNVQKSDICSKISNMIYIQPKVECPATSSLLNSEINSKAPKIDDSKLPVKPISKKQKDSTKKTAQIKTFVSTADENEPKAEKKLSKPPQNKISPELKKMIIDSLESGVCNRKSAASAFNLPYATVVTIYKKYLQTGKVCRKRKEEKIQEEQVQFLLDTLAENCTYSIKDLTEMVKSKYDLEVHYVSVSKKIPAFHYNINRVKELSIKEETEEIRNNHKEFCVRFLEFQKKGHPMIYFDEAEFKVLMRRFSGRIEPGQPGQVTAPSLRTRHKTILTSISKDRVLLYKALDDARSRADLLGFLKDLFMRLKAEKIVDAVIVLGPSVAKFTEDITTATKLAGHQPMFVPGHGERFSAVDALFCQLPAIVRSKEPGTETRLQELMDLCGDVINGAQCQSWCGHVTDNVSQCLAAATH